MLAVDLHTHTRCSHGRHGAGEMFAAGRERGLAAQGFSEHSPRPSGYDYPLEYRDRLIRLFPSYVREVTELKERNPGRVFLGMEMDWMEAERPFIERAVRAYAFDYLIGSVHFVGRWGFDADPRPWEEFDFNGCAGHFEAYFVAFRSMAESGLFHIAAHPDLIKIFSADHFRRWLTRGGLDLVREGLLAARGAGMSLEISSAGLRKPCREIYPGPEIMRVAAELKIPVVFGSDAHQVDDVAFAFPELARYAASFGFDRGSCVMGGERFEFFW
jgi:histidinol-phosphatase (PHP family)